MKVTKQDYELIKTTLIKVLKDTSYTMSQIENSNTYKKYPTYVFMRLWTIATQYLWENNLVSNEWLNQYNDHHRNTCIRKMLPELKAVLG